LLEERAGRALPGRDAVRICNDRETNDAESLAFNDVEWADVAAWDVSPAE
jgi:hypothetical protein